MDKLIESLSPNERKILPFLQQDFDSVSAKSGLDKVSVLRALEFLNSKKLIILDITKKKIADLGTNGVYYKKKGLPERRLIQIIEKGIISLEDAQKQSGLSDNEFKAAIGALKNKAIIEIKSGKIHLTETKEKISKKMPEEQFIELLPIDFTKMSVEQKFAFDNLKSRKEIIEINESQIITYELTETGRKLAGENLSEMKNYIEVLSPEMLRTNSWKGKKFRRYDILSPVPKICGGKRHFVNQSIEYGRKIWTELGFKEMTGKIIQPSFWNFDALFTAQDHPVRELQDTFYLDKTGILPDKKLINSVKEAHEKGVGGSTGWKYLWNEENAKRMVLRTHTTVLSALTLSSLKKSEMPAKFFAIGKNFRNETVDWSHGFEFNQTEGIVVDKNLTFRHLLGYLKEFFSKMGFEKIRFRPAYFPYTEPSVEIDIFHPEKKCWLELGGAGIFRPEVTIPLLGEEIPVLAWGPGFDRILMDYYEIKDLREMYKNDINQLRKMKVWIK